MICGPCLIPDEICDILFLETLDTNSMFYVPDKDVEYLWQVAIFGMCFFFWEMEGEGIKRVKSIANWAMERNFYK